MRWWDGMGWSNAVWSPPPGNHPPSPPWPGLPVAAGTAPWPGTPVGVGTPIGVGTSGRFPEIATLRPPAAALAVLLVAATVAGNFVVTAASSDARLIAGVVGLLVLALGVVGYPIAGVVASKRWGSGNVGADLGLRFRAADLGLGPAAAVVMFGVVIAVGLIVRALGVPQTSNLQNVEGHLRGPVLVFLIVLSGVLAPVTEELLFRGVLMRGLAARWGAGVAVLGQGVVFGLAHVLFDGGWGNVGLVLPLTGVGIVLGFVARTTGRLGAGMIAHSVYNLGQIALLIASAN